MANFEVPFDKDGNQLSYSGDWRVAEFKEPFEFEDTLSYLDYSRGRSAFNVHWVSQKTGKQFVSGMALLDYFLKSRKVKGNTISGTFFFKKQGTAILLGLMKSTQKEGGTDA